MPNDPFKKKKEDDLGLGAAIDKTKAKEVENSFRAATMIKAGSNPTPTPTPEPTPEEKKKKDEGPGYFSRAASYMKRSITNPDTIYGQPKYKKP